MRGKHYVFKKCFYQMLEVGVFFLYSYFQFLLLDDISRLHVGQISSSPSEFNHVLQNEIEEMDLIIEEKDPREHEPDYEKPIMN